MSKIHVPNPAVYQQMVTCFDFLIAYCNTLQGSFFNLGEQEFSKSMHYVIEQLDSTREELWSRADKSDKYEPR